jgi:hypothetical protein
VLIVGFITTGQQPLDVLSRGVGPTLGRFGVSGVLPHPSISLYSGENSIASNSDWESAPDRDLLVNESRRVFAFDLTPGAHDAAMLATLSPGSYTTQIGDISGGSGVALAEFYDRTPEAQATAQNRVVNISTRGRVGTGDDVLIGGFVVTGRAAKQVLIRGIGSGLDRFGVPNTLKNAYIRVVHNGQTVAQNDDWAYSPQAGLVAAAMTRAQAFAVDPAGRDAALVATLNPGSYTVILSGADGGEGVALVEVYDLE